MEKEIVVKLVPIVSETITSPEGKASRMVSIAGKEPVRFDEKSFLERFGDCIDCNTMLKMMNSVYSGTMAHCKRIEERKSNYDNLSEDDQILTDNELKMLPKVMDKLTKIKSQIDFLERVSADINKNNNGK